MTKAELIKKYKDKIVKAEHKVGESKYCTKVATQSERKEFLDNIKGKNYSFIPNLRLLYAYTKYLVACYKNLDTHFWNEYNAIWRASV